VSSCSGSGSSLGGLAKPYIFTSSSYKTYYQFIIFLSIWLCLLWIYILLSKLIFTCVCGFIERLACFSLSIGLSSQASCKHGAYMMLCLWVHPVLWLCGSSRWWQSRLSFVVHTKLSRFLNYRTVVTSVELSIVGALPSKRHPEVHKSRVSLRLVGCICTLTM
jgi:hypothetical protein